MERRILVIDDEERLAQSLAQLLRDEGYECEAAIGGREGIERLGNERFQLVITDLRMPDVDGFAVMDFITAKQLDTAIIVITGHASMQSAIAAIHQRVADYVTKPFEFDYLVASIEKVFAQREAAQMRQDMVRMITHDIKVPLNSIMGFAHFLVDRKTGAPSNQVPELSEKIVRNCQRIVGLLDNYLTHARAEAGRLEILPQPIRPDEIAHEAVRVVAHEFARRHIDFQHTIPELPGPIQGDEHLLFRAVCNLLNNAAKYTPEGGNTRLSVRTEERATLGPCVVVEVENDGPGIRAEELPTIFQRYRRAASGRGIEGSGLGLYVVQQVAQAHGGMVECESEEFVRTAFRIVLPCAGPAKG